MQRIRRSGSSVPERLILLHPLSGKHARSIALPDPDMLSLLSASRLDPTGARLALYRFREPKGVHQVLVIDTTHASIIYCIEMQGSTHLWLDEQSLWYVVAGVDPLTSALFRHDLATGRFIESIALPFAIPSVYHPLARRCASVMPCSREVALLAIYDFDGAYENARLDDNFEARNSRCAVLGDGRVLAIGAAHVWLVDPGRTIERIASSVGLHEGNNWRPVPITELPDGRVRVWRRSLGPSYLELSPRPVVDGSSPIRST